MTFKKEVRDAMQYFSVNQTEFAALLGISRSQLYKIYNGERALTYEVSQKLRTLQKEMTKTAEKAAQKKSPAILSPVVPAYYKTERLMRAETNLKEATARLQTVESDYAALLDLIRRHEESPLIKVKSEYAAALRDYHRNMKLLQLRKQQRQVERQKLLPAMAKVAGLRAEVEFWRAL